MPLILSSLVNNIRQINDEQYPLFEGFPANSIEAADRWSIAIGNYASLVIPPSSGSEAAKQALKSSLLSVPTLGEQAIVQGLISYSSFLALGMAPAFNAIPPPIPPVLTPAFELGFSGASAEQVANLLGSIIDGWFRTGTAINTISGVTVNWN